MKIKNLLKIIGFLVPAFVFVCTAAACSGEQSDVTPEGPTPKFILTTNDSGNAVGNFRYFTTTYNDVTGYAVALTDSGKNQSNITIPSTYNNNPVIGIWRYGFANSKATSVTIPNSITVIDFEAFMNSKITSVTIPASVDEIGEGAFYACKAITKVTIQNSTTSSESSSACFCAGEVEEQIVEREYSDLTTIPSFCFFNCNNLKELVLPESIEEIGYEAFNGCRQLYSTLAFANIKAIRGRAFQGCAALKNVYISSSFFDLENGRPVGVIEEKAFDDCNSALHFYLVDASTPVEGEPTPVDIWLALPENANNRWRWKNETTNPSNANNLYTYEITKSGASYSNDWIYTTLYNDALEQYEVTISSYIGPTTIDDTPIKLITFPDELPSGSGHVVTRITTDALNNVQSSLERVYLPKTLKRIEPNMFTASFTNLVVIDDNTGSKCTIDDSANQENPLVKRIFLDGLTNLEVIGNSAFVNMNKIKTIEKLYLPYSLKAVGKNAFGSTSQHMEKVTDFRWVYDDAKSALKVIGQGAFYGLGRNDENRSVLDSNAAQYQELYNGTTEAEYQLTSLIIPRTFEHFGITSTDNNTYNLGGAESSGNDFGISAFAGCPLLGEVVFKGSPKSVVQSKTTDDRSTQDTNTCNLIIPNQTFILNESLRTIVFEERCGWNILFHTAGGLYKPAIGWSSGKNKNDFSGNSTIQTIVLPTRYTTIRMQKYAMQGNSRGVVYLSGPKDDSSFRGCDQADCATLINNITSGDTECAGNHDKWNLIGDENFDSGDNINTYTGYCFATNVNNQSTHTQNSFDLNQSMPIYTNVLYQQTIGGVQTFVGLGQSNSENEFVVDNKCAFVTNGSNATLTKYLYDRYDDQFEGTANVPDKVSKASGTKCTVNKIGKSAFSAAYCDEATDKNYKNDTTHKDLVAVAIPDSITTIEEYAFMRAYGVKKLYAYSSYVAGNAPCEPRVENNYYVMPTNLDSIGKHAFAFCNIEQLLQIPVGCTFYETTDSASGKSTSAFSNNFSLRRITFGNTDATESTYYETTTYSHDIDNENSVSYTSAIYSKNNTSKNSSSLLLVLNRDASDYLTASDGENSDVRIVTNQQSQERNELKGNYKGHYIYGAFKMCYWVDSLVVGTPADGSINQPLISGIYNVAQNKDNYLYLNTPNNFTSNKNNCKLETVVFGNSGLSTPAYSFEGCANLTYMRLPRIEGAVIPKGLLALVENPNIQFEVPDTVAGDHFKTCSAGELDLTFTAYAGIDDEVFKGTSIKTLIAPKPWDGAPNTFTIGQDAFANCSLLTSIDFSNVTGTVVLNKSFRGATIRDDLFDFGTNALIEFGDETFKKCTFLGNKTFKFPEKTALIGNSCFEGCTTLDGVTGEDGVDVLRYLKRVVVDAGKNQNNTDKPEGFKQIGNYAFFRCTNLKNVDFSIFEEVERIGHYAFGMYNIDVDSTTAVINPDGGALGNNADICSGGKVNLPASITNLGVGAFFGSKITSVTINSSSLKYERGNSYTSDKRASHNLGGHTFRRCSKLEKVIFTVPDCEWRTPYITKRTGNGGQDNYYSNCDKLTVVTMPTGYDLQYSAYTTPPNDNNGKDRPDSMSWGSNSSLKFYVYHSTKDYDPNGQDISAFWHRIAAGEVLDIVYYVETLDDVRDPDTFVEYRTKEPYWTFINGEIVYLGTAEINAQTGAVTFSSGKTINSLTYAINDESTTLAYNPALNAGTRASEEIHLNANDVVTVSLNGNALKYGASGDATSFTATVAGDYVLKVDGNDRFFVICPATAIEINEGSSTSLTLGIDSSYQLTTTITPSYSTEPLAWTSSDDSVATVSQAGLITPVSEGTTTITVTAGSVSDSFEVTIVDNHCILTYGETEVEIDYDPTDNVTRAQENISLGVGDTVSVALNETPLYYGASGSATTFTATVAGDYIFTIDGDDRFYVTCDTTSVVIQENSSTITTRNVYLSQEASITLVAVPTPANATDEQVWTSSVPAVATVSNGVVTPLTSGTTRITVTMGEASYYVDVTVLDYCVLTYGQNQVVLNYDGSNNTTRATQNLNLTANDVVSISLNGNALLYGQSGNDTSFTAPDTGAYIITVNGSDRFTYELPATAVDIQENSASINSRTMYVGDADATFVAVLSPEHSTDEVTWTSSDDNVATVDSNGVVHAVGRGTATITATAGSVSDSVTVDVHTYYSLRAGDNEYLLNNHKGSGETEEYYSDIIELDEGDTVQILYDGVTPTEGVYSRNTAGHNNLGASGIVNAGEVEVFANKYTKQIWVSGYARITYNGTSYIAERENDASYYIDVDLVSGNAVTAGSIGSSDLTASLSVDTGIGNNLKDNAGALTVISSSNNARIYLHSDGTVWVTGLTLEDSFKLIYGTDGGSESTWSYANGTTGNALASADPNVESQAEFVVTLAQNEEFKILDVNGNYLGADIAESPYYRSEGGNIVLNCLGEHHVYLKKYTNGNYGIAIAVENHTISLDLTTSSSWTDDNAVIWAYVWEGQDGAQGSAWYRASNYTEITIKGSYSNMILVRKNPSNDYAGWEDGVWNQTSDLSLNDTTYNQILKITGWNNSSTWVDKE